jgi:hypothetical protein
MKGTVLCIILFNIVHIGNVSEVEKVFHTLGVLLKEKKLHIGRATTKLVTDQFPPWAERSDGFPPFIWKIIVGRETGLISTFAEISG